MTDTEPSSRLSLALEGALSLGAAALLGPLLFDAITGSFHEGSVRIEHGIAQALLGPLGLASELGLLDPTWTRWSDLLMPSVVVLFLAALVTTTAALLDPPPGAPAGLGRKLLSAPLLGLLGLPALAITLLGVLAGALLAPEVFGLCLGASLFGGILGSRRRRAPLAHEASLSGLPPAMWATDHALRFALVAAGFEAIFLTAALGAGGSGALLRSVLVAIDQNGLLGPALLGNGVTMGSVLLLLAAPTTRRTLGTLTWEPWVAATAGLLAMAGLMSASGGWWEIRVGAPMGFAAGLAGTLLAASGQPTLPRLAGNPVRAIGRLHAPIIASVMAVAYALSTGFLGCSTVLADSRVEALSRNPAASAVAWTEGGIEATALAAIPDEHMILRVGVASGSTGLLDLDTVPLQALSLAPSAVGEGPRSTAGVEHVLPGPFGRDAEGRTLLGFVTSQGTSSGVLELDGASGAVTGVAEVEGGCAPASWAWNPWLELGMMSCADRSELGLYEPTLGRYLTQVRLDITSPLRDLGVDPRTGEVLGLAGGHSPFLLRVSPKTGRTLGWRFVGSTQSALFVDATGTAHLPRRFGRQVLSMDGQSLGPVAVGRAGFGGAALTVSRRHARVLSASALDGYLYASRPGDDARVPRLRVGGGVRSMALSNDESTLLVAGFCGVLAVDLERWLGP